MNKIGESSLWEFKYTPSTVNDLILPKKVKSLFQGFINDGEIDSMLFSGTAGLGKTSSALALVNDLDADLLFINGSLNNGIDVVRNEVNQFANTGSFKDGKKIVIIDEIDRMMAGQEALKSLQEQTEVNCRFIFTTNNLHKIIDPIKSRLKHISFNFGQAEKKALVIAYFKRLCFILDNENVKYDKQTLAEYTQTMFPDFRQKLVRLQLCAKMNGEINNEIFTITDDSLMQNLVAELKNKKFNAVRKIISEINPEEFYSNFYSQIDDLLDPQCLPNVITTLGQHAYESALSVAKEVTLAKCCTELMKECRWR